MAKRLAAGSRPRRVGAAGVLACVLAALACDVRAAANDPTALSLEQLLDLDVQSASKFTQKASEAPSAVTVITATDIRRFGYRTLADILNSVPGLYVHYDRNYSYVGVRGFGPLGNYNSRVLVLVDGYRINEPVYGQGSIGREFALDVDLIERVEFVAGPGSAIYGSNAFFGVVNVITRSGRALRGAEVSAAVASHETGRARATYGRRYANDLEVLLSVSGYSSQGRDLHFPEFEVPGVSDGIAHGRDWERANSVFAKASMGAFTIEAAHGVRSKGIPTASFEALFDDPRTQTRDAQSFAELRYEDSIARDLDLEVRLNRGYYSYRGHYPYDAGNGIAVVNVDSAKSTWWGGEAKLVSRGFDGHKIVLGAEYQRNTRKDQDNFDLDPPLVYLREHHRSSQVGLYVQDEVTLRSDLALNAGLRYDRYSTFGNITNPRLALIYTPEPSLTVKALYGKAYRAPNDSELFFSSQSLQWKANPTLAPERIATYELVSEWRPASLTRVRASAFRYRISDLITLTSDPLDGLNQYRNTGRASAGGVQAEIEQLWRDGASLRASYSYQRAKDETGRWLVNSPRHLAKIDGSLPLRGDALRGGLSLRHASSRLTRLGATSGSYTVVDLTLASERIAGGELAFSIYNVFDREYLDPVSDAHVQDTIRQDGRSLRLKYTLRF